MDDSHRGGKRRRAAEELILRTIAAHAESLLRTARRHSLCADDAQDAYQRAIEIFMGHAQRLDAARAPGWLLSTQAILGTGASDLSRLVTGEP
jgi:DNA-directed RNA polymerase specialized sigma24 family protein